LQLRAAETDTLSQERAETTCIFSDSNIDEILPPAWQREILITADKERSFLKRKEDNIWIS
jgi:hypothetical protein